MTHWSNHHWSWLTQRDLQAQPYQNCKNCRCQAVLRLQRQREELKLKKNALRQAADEVGCFAEWKITGGCGLVVGGWWLFQSSCFLFHPETWGMMIIFWKKILQKVAWNPTTLGVMTWCTHTEYTKSKKHLEHCGWFKRTKGSKRLFRGWLYRRCWLCWQLLGRYTVFPRKLTAKDPQKWWLEDDVFLSKWCVFRGHVFFWGVVR